MQGVGFFFCVASGFFTVFLLAWNGLDDYSHDWVYGFLAAYWSVMMLIRLMTLTTPYVPAQKDAHLAQKILSSFYERQEENRQEILEKSFGGSFALFLTLGFAFAAWMGFCAVFSADAPAVRGLSDLVGSFDSRISLGSVRLFDWGQVFLLFLTFSMMGFVIRSHAGIQSLARPVLIVLAGYAVSGLIAFAGLAHFSGPTQVLPPDLVGSGPGAAGYLLGISGEKTTANLFEILLVEGGVIGLALMSFLFFIPLGYLCLGAQQAGNRDSLSLGAGMLIGIIMILSVFLPFTPAFGGFVALCWMGLFLAWGLGENPASPQMG